jgi:hypothetical protein
MKNRREFLTTAAVLTLSSKLHAINHDLLKLKTPLSGPPTAGVALAVSATRRHTVPANFIGLSYESETLAGPRFFSDANHQLVAQFKTLAPAGILRLGGSTSEFSWWQPTPGATAPVRPERAGYTGSPSGSLSYPITPEAIDHLARFLHATGWTCIYGLNLGNGGAELDTAEAVYVANALGRHLEYFQIGNAVDLFAQNFRDPATWSPQVYCNEWLRIARAITEKVPTAQFGGPDIASHPDIASQREWFSAFAAALAATDNPPRVAALSHHHYAGGQQTTIPALLSGADRNAVDAAAAIGSAAATQLHAALRVVEANTCTGGGKPGVSDVFASALWSADYALHLASLGYAGVNLHGGDARTIADSLGRELPGEASSNSSHPRPAFTPIADIDGLYTAEPVFYGLLLARHFAGATMLDVTFDPTFTPANSAASGATTARVNATAYAAICPDGKTVIAVINKDLTNDLTLHITGAWPSSILRLKADSPAATDVTFASAAITSNGAWNPRPESAVIFLGHNAPIHLAKSSAVLLISH